ncbi:MAG TPA: archaeosortase A [Candidatus Methanoperedenaceae archaeon]|nr:archaeosortase A [Candidatus Methanoperedenaceae archaeon]
MIEYVLWAALALLAIASVVPSRPRAQRILGAWGWALFGVHWGLQPLKYMAIDDYFNVGLTAVVALFCFFMAYCMLRGSDRDTLNRATAATAIGGLVYFMFAETTLNRLIISLVTDQTLWAMWMLKIPAGRLDWNIITLNGYRVEIVLACTAIESMALFIGTIFGVNAPAKRILAAFAVSVPVIYILNLVRNVFIIAAYGLGWFGTAEQSFYIAHAVVAKIGSTIALFIIAYAVLRILPELFLLIDGVFQLIQVQVRHLIGGHNAG